MMSIIVSAGLLMGVLSLWLGGMVPPSPSAVNPMIKATLSPIAPPLSPSGPVTGTVKISEIDGAEMVYVPAGEFIMGSSESDPMASHDEKPQHTVYLDAFWINKSEVTNARYRKCVDAGACALPHDTRYYDDPAYADHPVVYVDWPQAQAYCQWAGGRLPTEAEWEKAARGIEGRIWPWGNEWDEKKANTVEAGPGSTTPVGSYPGGASPYGTLDMAGNVWEWVADWYDAGYYPQSPSRNPQGPHWGANKVLRGGSWYADQGYARCAYRNSSHSFGYEGGGFRCACDS